MGTINKSFGSACVWCTGAALAVITLATVSALVWALML